MVVKASFLTTVGINVVGVDEGSDAEEEPGEGSAEEAEVGAQAPCNLRGSLDGEPHSPPPASVRWDAPRNRCTSCQTTGF